MKAKDLLEWRQKTQEKDNYACRRCARQVGKVAAHHTKAKDQYPKLTLEIENGVSLCYHCHSLMPMQLKLFRVDNGYKNGYWYPKRLLKLANSELHNQPI